MCAALRTEKRRREWRLGRWVAKHCLLGSGRVPAEGPLSALEILAAADGAPEAHVEGRGLEVSLSITHRDGRAVCAVARSSETVGCDLERVEPRSEAFLADYFTEAERGRVERAGDGALQTSLMWSAKESALKVLRTGLRRDTRSVEVVELQRTGVWSRLGVRDAASEELLAGWWRTLGSCVFTVLSRPPPTAPPALVPLGPVGGPLRLA